MDPKALGRVFRELRNSKGWTLEETAQKAALSKAMISKVELGQANVTIDTMTKLESALGVKLAISLGDGQALPVQPGAAEGGKVEPMLLISRLAIILPKLHQRELQALEVLIEGLERRK